jgi:choline dehydrogenase-like flavoprotein
VTCQFDAIIVGAGQAGPPLAGRLTDAGHTVAAMERKLIGGTCVNTGCIPTKLVACAHAPALGPARRRVRRRHGTTGHQWVRGLLRRKHPLTASSIGFRTRIRRCAPVAGRQFRGGGDR